MSEDHPFVKCGLEKYFDHLKGTRKELVFHLNIEITKRFQIKKITI